MHNFVIGEEYNRRIDIHGKYSGNQQAGIAVSSTHPVIFLFTGNSGEQFGYSDYWKNGIFHYTGAGRTGDMIFDHYNRPVRDHMIEGRDLMVFEMQGKGKLYKFMGQFACSGYDLVDLPDEKKDIRKAIVFQLQPLDGASEDLGSDVDFFEQEALDFDVLRQKAYASIAEAKQTSTTEGKSTYYKRNAYIKSYVLERAAGYCECCGAKAPFTRKNGTPYLEPHHIGKLSDKGFDDPRMMAALTPNCHREIHSGVNGGLIDERLKEAIANKEAKLEVLIV